PHLDHAGTGITLGNQLTQAHLQLVHLLLDLRQVLHQPGQLPHSPEHVEHHSASSCGASPRLCVSSGTAVPNPSSTRVPVAPSISTARFTRGTFSASSRGDRRGEATSPPLLDALAAPGLGPCSSSTRTVQVRPVTLRRTASTRPNRSWLWQ